MSDAAGIGRTDSGSRLQLLLLSLSYPNVANEENIHTDFANELGSRGIEIRVVAPTFNGPTALGREGSVDVLRVRSGPLFNTGRVVKGINTVLLPYRYRSAIQHHFFDWQADWVISATPPVTLAPVIKSLKKRWSSNFYLILRDIFPQNALDLGMMQRGPAYDYFRRQETALYEAADLIGCMSPGNAQYLKVHNQYIESSKVTLLPNWTSSTSQPQSDDERVAFRQQWGIPSDALVCVFGGNLGLPQKVDFLIEAATRLQEHRDIYFFVVGSGTQAEWMQRAISHGGLRNTRWAEHMPRSEYDALLRAADVGIITLHEKFTIPNIPSRLLGYWAAGIPVLAATDTNTDLRQSFIDRYKAGRWVEMGDIQGFISALRWFQDNPSERRAMGSSGQQAVESHYTTASIADLFLTQLGGHQIPMIKVSELMARE